MANNTCETHSGWTINDTTEGISWNTGVLTKMDNSFCAPSSYTISFCGWEEIPHIATFSTKSCNDCDMLVTWFNTTATTVGNFTPLDEGAAKQFCVKNVNECEFIATTTDPSRYPFEEYPRRQIPPADTYVDGGIPSIYSQKPITASSASSASISYSGSSKYTSGVTYSNLMKIKYKLTNNNNTLLPKTITQNANLQELYIPKSVHIIQSGAFSGNTNLSAVTMMNCFKIEEGAFSGCSNLEEVNVNGSFDTQCKGNNSLEIIGASAFCRTNLNYFIASQNLTSVGTASFVSPKLSYVYFPPLSSNNSSLTIAPDAFTMSWMGQRIIDIGWSDNDLQNKVTLNGKCFTASFNGQSFKLVLRNLTTKEQAQKVINALYMYNGHRLIDVYSNISGLSGDNLTAHTLSDFSSVTISGGGFG